MKIKKFLVIHFLTLLIVIIPFKTAWTDSWALPEKTKYFSENKKFRFTVTPGPVGRREPGEPETCIGTLEVKENGKNKYNTVWEKTLSNEVAPVSALVTNSGNYVITFDNWHELGYGDNVIVIYNQKGETIRQLGLNSFLSNKEIKKLPHTVSSIWWGGAHHFDQNEEFVVLEISTGGKLYVDEAVKYRHIFLKLSDGTVVKK
jgi:hypothetical protein